MLSAQPMVLVAAILLVVLVYRGGQQFIPQGGTVLEAGDRLLLLAEGEPYLVARRVLAGDE